METFNPDIQQDKLDDINKVLRNLAEDENFQEDLKDPIVIKAIKHWTGAERLDPDQANKLFFGNKYSGKLNQVLAKFRLLQHFCSQAGIAVPLPQVLYGWKSFTSKDGLDTNEKTFPSTSNNNQKKGGEENVNDVNDKNKKQMENETNKKKKYRRKYKHIKRK